MPRSREADKSAAVPDPVFQSQASSEISIVDYGLKRVRDASRCKSEARASLSARLKNFIRHLGELGSIVAKIRNASLLHKKKEEKDLANQRNSLKDLRSPAKSHPSCRRPLFFEASEAQPPHLHSIFDAIFSLLSFSLSIPSLLLSKEI